MSKIQRIHRSLWLMSVLAAIAFFISLLHFGYFPLHWILLLASFFVGGFILLYRWTKKRKSTTENVSAIFLHIFLIGFLGLAAFYLPTLRYRLYSIFSHHNVEESSLNFKEPFTVYIAGNDQEGDLSTSGRYDVNMIITINFATSDVLITSIPRDSYFPNPAFSYDRDKLTHMGLNGVENSMSAISQVFNTPVNHYVIVNFTTFRNIVDALGGVYINNPYAFDSSLSNYVYPEGELLLNGYEALFYVRERFNLPSGDFDRNAHQVIMLKAILEQLLHPSTIFKLDDVFKALSNTFLTNIPDSEIEAIVRYELQNLPRWNIVNYHIKGGVGSAACSSHFGEVLSVVFPYQEDIDFIAHQLDNIYQNQPIKQVSLPSEQ